MGSSCVKCGGGSLVDAPEGTPCVICYNKQILVYTCESCKTRLCSGCADKYKEGTYQCGVCKYMIGLDVDTYKGKKCTDCGATNVLMYKCLNTSCRLPYCSKCAKREAGNHHLKYKAENQAVLKTVKE